jgi:hypothetical protein
MISENKITGLVITIWGFSMLLGIISIHYVRQNAKLTKKNRELSEQYYTIKNNFNDCIIDFNQKVSKWETMK